MEDFEEIPPEREGIDRVQDREERYIHPVAKRARDPLDPLLKEMKAAGDKNSPGDESFFDFTNELMTCGVKLCAYLSFLVYPYHSGAGLLIAWLILNKTLAALEALHGHRRFPEKRRDFFPHGVVCGAGGGIEDSRGAARGAVVEGFCCWS